jgi:hypothetical protein
VVMLRRQTLILDLGVFFVFVLGLAVEGHADTLFKSRQPVKIGHGKKEGSTIHWTDCSDQKSETFDAPPYSLDPADNCAVGPPTFGLQCEGDLCTVVDETKMEKYVPNAHNGEKVHLRIKDHSVELNSSTTTLRLEK